MQEVMIEQVRSRIPNCEIVLASPFPKIDKAFYRDSKIIKASRRNLPWAILKLLLLLVIPRSLQRRLFSWDSEIKQYFDADLVVDLSGDMLTEDYGIPIAISHMLPIWIAKSIGKKYMIIAQSIGPFKITKPIYRHLLRGAKLISARDRITQDYLHRLALEKVKLTSDLGFLLQCAPDAKSIAANDSPLKLGIAPSGLLARMKFNNFDGRKRDVISEMATMVNQLHAQREITVTLVPHVQSPRRNQLDDLDVCNSLMEAIEAPVTIADTRLSPREMKALVSRLDVFVAFRMHAAIAGLDTLVPTVGISYSQKTNGLFQQLQLMEYVVRYDDKVIENLRSVLNRLIDNRLMIRQHLEVTLSAVRKRAELNIDYVVEELTRDG